MPIKGGTAERNAMRNGRLMTIDGLSGKLSSLWDYTTLLAGREWIQAESGQESRLPTNGKKSRIESVPNAGIS
jgi:hypothetical protein